MVQYTNPELTDMVLIYEEALSNAAAARRLYVERFPDFQVPCERTFVDAVQHLRDYGTFSSVNRNRGRSRSRRVLDLEPEILQAVEEEPNVLDEIINVLRLVESISTPPRTHQLLQELRDLTSMAMEHFEEHVLPRVKQQKEQMDENRQAFIGSFSGNLGHTKPSKPCIVQQANDLQKIRNQYKTYKHHIAYLNQNTQKLIQKMKKQNKRLKAQSVKIRDQERKIQEQSVKIQEQESTLADIRKYMDEWDQKYKDLKTELVRARDYILLKPTTPAKSTTTVFTHPPFSPKTLRSSIRPRVSHILLKNYGPFSLDVERKRKSNLLPDIPVKVSRIQDDHEEKNVDKLIPLKDPDKGNEGKGNFSFLFENLIRTPLTGIKSRKRKMAEDIDLK